METTKVENYFEISKFNRLLLDVDGMIISPPSLPPLSMQAIFEQFRRVANMYFLIMGIIMGIGWYTNLYESAISPWTTLGPLAFVISISLLQEGTADIGRARSDSTTNHHPCVVLRRASDLDEEDGERETSLLNGNDVGVNLKRAYFLGSSVATTGHSDCNIAFESVKRMDIRQGNIVLLRNRDMIPADMILVASSADNGSSYIETSSIDGETNLKLRTSPHLPKEVHEQLDNQSDRVLQEDNADKKVRRETLEQATKRIARVSVLGFPNGVSALDNPANAELPASEHESTEFDAPSSGLNLMGKGKTMAKKTRDSVKNLKNFGPSSRNFSTGGADTEIKYVTALKTEPPNASVNTFTGLMLLPPIQLGGPSVEIPLDADNMLLRGAVLRNTEWAIGVVVFTGKDTKLVQNSFETPSKFSKLDQIINRTVLYILVLVGLIIAYLATWSVITSAEQFDNLWYVSRCGVAYNVVVRIVTNLSFALGTLVSTITKQSHGHIYLIWSLLNGPTNLRTGFKFTYSSLLC